MDKGITYSSWATITGKSWEDNFNKLIKIKTEFSGINYLQIYLPYASIKTSEVLQTDYQNKTTEVLNEIGLISLGTRGNAVDIESIRSIMILYIKEEYNKKVCGIKFTFPAIYKTQKITKMPKFFYKWTKNSVTIHKTIASFNTETINKQAIELFNECQRFKFLYCEKYVNK